MNPIDRQLPEPSWHKPDQFYSEVSRQTGSFSAKAILVVSQK